MPLKTILRTRPLPSVLLRPILSPLLRMDHYHRKLRELDIKGAIFEVDARDFNDMSHLVQALLFTIDPGLEYSA